MRNNSRGGFTLVEILIVISIIAVLASLTLGAVIIARRHTYIALANTFVSNLSSQVERYVQDTGKYPGSEVRDEENAFPALFEALFGEKPSAKNPHSKGGPNAPYMELKQADVLVPDEDHEGDYRQATTDEIDDPKVPKYIRDPWGKPYVYHENKSRARRPYMKRANKCDIYSTGPDMKDKTTNDEGKDDDVGNW